MLEKCNPSPREPYPSEVSPPLANSVEEAVRQGLERLEQEHEQLDRLLYTEDSIDYYGEEETTNI